uniref:VWFD domain-containing protein n=1 Tax=Gasterosteus aculeatus aculeatus TaxID=481459 RepID=G3Q5Q1_GASAC|nr:mucin-19-like [Gasterosteus aculeatus aculeatus]
MWWVVCFNCSRAASDSMTTQRWILAFCLSLASVFGTVELFKTKEIQTYTCRTFGSGIVQPFKGESYYVRSDCPFKLTSFNVNRGEYSVTIRRGHNGLLVQVEIIVNKVTTLLQNGHILVQNNSVSLPYDHTYQHIFKYGIYTRLRSSLLPFTVTWHNVHGGINSLWVTLESELCTDMCGLCGKQNVAGHRDELIRESKLHDHRCKIRDPVLQKNHICRRFFLKTKNCLQDNNSHYHRLCKENICGFENSQSIFCPFFQEVASQCNQSRINRFWRRLTRCAKPRCPGDLIYEKKGPAFIPSCSNPNPAPFYQELTETCACPKGKVLNNCEKGYRCIRKSSCSCEFAGKTYGNGEIRSSRCQSCTCDGGKWRCSENFCHRRCVIEGQFVTTFDGKQYVLPNKCLYVASKGPNWIIIIEFSQKKLHIRKVTVQLMEELFVFTKNKALFDGQEISEFHLSGHAQVYWVSSMFIQVHTTIGINFQIQMSPEIQLFIDAPDTSNDKIKGLCGNSNSDTTDDFTTNSGIIENSAKPFAMSWSLLNCFGNIPTTCTNLENENYAYEKCAVLNQPTGIFAKCHPHIPTDYYYTACIQRICNSAGSRRQGLCIGLASYAKACAGVGVVIGDWRRITGCDLKCQKNQEFSYSMHICNRTCTSLSGHDIRCDMNDDPVEGCGCPEGTHLNQGQTCCPKEECGCIYYGGIAAPGPVVIAGQKCNCKNGILSCLPNCDCRNGKVCVSCSEGENKSVRNTCDYISKPKGTRETCKSGCYCPDHQYEDHHGNCVSLDDCTCVFSGKAFKAGQQVTSNCKTCTCYRGQWHCIEKPCPGQCQVYGNGHYQTFDSKWFRFSGQCLYTLVQDSCDMRRGTFSIRVESVPCCEEVLTCSRNIILDLKGQVTLTLRDMQVIRRLHEGWNGQDDSLYSIHTLGLYIVISVPSKGITLIWDKHTRITVELAGSWKNRVCGLCGNFDSNEMNDLSISGSSVSSPMAFGNCWKVQTPPCSDVTTDIFPCERNSYCAAWAQQRCLILTGETFSECHLKVDPDPYYDACVQESCSCESDGKFLGFCTAVAAYAQACSEQHVCVNWRTPDMCPVYCDYYNKHGQSLWHYEACGQMLTCGREHYISHKLEGCYPRCTEKKPYYDENTGGCTSLGNCTCYFNGTIIEPQAVVVIQNVLCRCENGAMNCDPSSSTTPTSSTHTASDSTTRDVTRTHHTHTASDSTTRDVTRTHHTHTASDSTTRDVTPTSHTHTSTDSTTDDCQCFDPKNYKIWHCGETWTEDCFKKTCIGGLIELSPVVCPVIEFPDCPRDKFTKVLDGCCETLKCDCHCEIYGDSHYTTFQGVKFDFLTECTNILVKEISSHPSLYISVENENCVAGRHRSCAKSITVKYQGSKAVLSIHPDFSVVKVTLNGLVVQPPLQAAGFRFESTMDTVTIYMPEIRSYVSLSQSHNLVVSLAMEYFHGKTQGQCGVCGVGSCIRKGGKMEDNSCCDKTAYSWVKRHGSKPACALLPRDVECDQTTAVPPTTTTSLPCPSSALCVVLDHPAFSKCIKHLMRKKKICVYGSCDIDRCSILKRAAKECMKAGVCIDWRALTNGKCTMTCPKGLVYRQCRDKLDDFCLKGIVKEGAPFECTREGCFCPHGQIKADQDSNICVTSCPYCKGPLGEPKQPGDVWESGCHICKCNKETGKEECHLKPLETKPSCSPDSVLVNKPCCGEKMCVKKTCKFGKRTYQVGESWSDDSNPCQSYHCTLEGIQTAIRDCPRVHCHPARLIWDDHKCCKTCNNTCAPVFGDVEFRTTDCHTILHVPVCMGECGSGLSIKAGHNLCVHAQNNCCQEKTSETKTLSAICYHPMTNRREEKTFTYKHITSCECRLCNTQH